MASKYKATKKIGKALKYTIFTANLIAIIFLILATQAHNVSPIKFVFISYLGLAFPVLLVINILFLLFWIITFRWKYIIVQLIAFAFCINSLTTYFPINKPSEHIPEEAIKVMTYNVRGFDWLIGKEARENPVLEYIANSNSDIICMQEFAVESKKDKNKIISLDEFDDIMENYPYRTIIRLGDTIGSTIYGLACYSKYPIRKVARIPIDSQFNGSAMYEIRLGKKDITIVNNHLESNRITAEDKALYKELVVNKDSHVINEVAESVFKRLDPAFKTRAKQADIISHYIEMQRKNTPDMIICGDFNDSPMSYAFSEIKGDFVDSYTATGSGVGITYHEDNFLFRIDFIMYTPNMKSYNCTVGKVKYSDHYPVWTYITI